MTGLVVLEDPQVRRRQAPQANVDARVSRLAGTLAHELKNPLASAMTNVAVVAEFCDEADPRRSFVDRALHDLGRVDALLRACLELACAERIHRRKTILADLLARFASENVRVSIPSDLSAKIDPVLVERAIENVLENAGNVADRDPKARIAARIRGNELVLTVEDDGEGVPHGLRDRIFDPFVSASGGTGLGLAFVRRVCQAHGGDARVADASSAIDCEGEESYRGARFELTLAVNSDSA